MTRACTFGHAVPYPPLRPLGVTGKAAWPSTVQRAASDDQALNVTTAAAGCGLAAGISAAAGGPRVDGARVSGR
jgi:hypothetical protein